MRRIKVIKQTMEWYDIPDDVILDMEKLTKDFHSKLSNIMSINIISDVKINDVDVTPDIIDVSTPIDTMEDIMEDTMEVKDEECSEKSLPESE
jgi:hypothetical protein